MSKIKRIVVHCTSDPSDAVRNREYFRNLFFDIYKWKHFGYHVVVYQDGSYDILQPLPMSIRGVGIITYDTMANGAKGYNNDSLHIAYVGGLNPFSYRPLDTRTPEQRATLRAIVTKWKNIYGIKEVVGHCDLTGVKKACPCFDARKEYENA